MGQALSIDRAQAEAFATTLEELATPCLILDAERMERNIARLLKRQSIASGEIASLFIATAISDGQASQLVKNFENNQVSLDGNIEFNSKVRPFPRVVGQPAGVQTKLINASFRASAA